jgi:hypothetical protein
MAGGRIDPARQHAGHRQSSVLMCRGAHSGSMKSRIMTTRSVGRARRTSRTNASTSASGTSHPASMTMIRDFGAIIASAFSTRRVNALMGLPPSRPRAPRRHGALPFVRPSPSRVAGRLGRFLSGTMTLSHGILLLDILSRRLRPGWLNGPRRRLSAGAARRRQSWTISVSDW